LTVIYDNKKWAKKNGYYQSTLRKFVGKKWLHQYVYEKEVGIILNGYEIHHIDKNKDNNDISNLELVKSKEHGHKHTYRDNPERMKNQKEHLDKIRPKETYKWSQEPDLIKREQHRAKHKSAMALIEPVKYICVNCGKEFMNTPNGIHRFCSNSCKSAYRRKMGFDNEERICMECGKSFTVNHYVKSVTCSPHCQNVKRAKTIKARKDELRAG